MWGFWGSSEEENRSCSLLRRLIRADPHATASYTVHYLAHVSFFACAALA